MDLRKATIAAVLLAAFLIGLAPDTVQAETVYFVVARPGLYSVGIGDSYILPLSDPADIALARDIIITGSLAIVSARVVKGSDGINRDWLTPGQPLWSWHVVAFDGFTMSAIELCDGNPTFTEAEAGNWSEGEQIQICYWTYTVVEEVVLPVSTEPSTWGRIKSLYESP